MPKPKAPKPSEPVSPGVDDGISMEEALAEIERRKRERARLAAQKPLALAQERDANYRAFGGTLFAPFNEAIVEAAVGSSWGGNEVLPEQKDARALATAGALHDVAPTSAVEGMLAAQLIATHNAAMECFRRAMIPNQPPEYRDANLLHANRLTRSYAALVQALDKHRGRGAQTVRVEHVHVHQGGQAVVGNVVHGGAPAALMGVDQRRVEEKRDEALIADLLADRGEATEA